MPLQAPAHAAAAAGGDGGAVQAVVSRGCWACSETSAALTRRPAEMLSSGRA